MNAIALPDLSAAIKANFYDGLFYAVFSDDLSVLSAVVSTGLRVVEVSAKTMMATGAYVPPQYANCIIVMRDLHTLGDSAMRRVIVNLRESITVFAGVVILPETFEWPPEIDQYAQFMQHLSVEMEPA
jgi:hypothetical protein